MPSIFEYTDYRKYLADSYMELKKSRPRFSYRLFADMAGFKDKSSLFGLISGHRNLGKDFIVQLSRALKHRPSEADYFASLVGYNQGRTMEERDHYFERLNSIRGKGATRARLLRKDQFDFYAQWYHSAVRSLIDLVPIKNDFTRLARLIRPRITPKQARESVQLLLRLEIITRRRNGTYELTHKSISSGNDVQSHALQRFHVMTAQLAQDAIARLPRKQRNISGLTLGISEKTYLAICERINTFQDDIMALADRDNSADRVYQLNFHLFPLSKI